MGRPRPGSNSPAPPAGRRERGVGAAPARVAAEGGREPRERLVPEEPPGPEPNPKPLAAAPDPPGRKAGRPHETPTLAAPTCAGVGMSMVWLLPSRLLTLGWPTRLLRRRVREGALRCLRMRRVGPPPGGGGGALSSTGEGVVRRSTLSSDFLSWVDVIGCHITILWKLFLSPTMELKLQNSFTTLALSMRV